VRASAVVGSKVKINRLIHFKNSKKYLKLMLETNYMPICMALQFNFITSKNPLKYAL
jgi:hypothetical protein